MPLPSDKIPMSENETQQQSNQQKCTRSFDQVEKTDGTENFQKLLCRVHGAENVQK